MKKNNLRKEIVYQEVTEKMTDEEIRSMEETKIKLYDTNFYRIFLKNRNNTGYMFHIPTKYNINEIEDFFVGEGYRVFERHNFKDRTIVVYLHENDSIGIMDFFAKLGMFGPAIFPFDCNEVLMFKMGAEND